MIDTKIFAHLYLVLHFSGKLAINIETEIINYLPVK